MKKHLFLSLILFITFFVKSLAQENLKSPSEFLGYTLGSKFTAHHLVVDYYKYLASKSKNIKLQFYGKTNEGRELFVAFIGNDEDINHLEDIRKNNLRLAGIVSGSGSLQQSTIVWLSYNVHGNEAVSTEASLQTVYTLLNPADAKNKEWLKNTLVVIDPCLNPDGRERYVNFYNPLSSLNPDPKSFTREHREPWPGGRANHYYFDLNRDWAWQTQIETQQRLTLYNQWLPQVHVDFHEQGYNEPYYFAPAAAPFHEVITKWQKDFQTIVGNNNAKYFDQNGWLYFTKERFDLLYPSYGDTYPIYNGSIGMTFEQGGIGAGLAIITNNGDTLTLKDRIDHHFTTGISTIEVASKNAQQLNNEFKKFFTESKTSPDGKYKSYVVKADNDINAKKLADLLKRNGIEVSYGLNKQSKGYNYFTDKIENFNISPEDMIVNAYQPKSVLLKVLMEPKTALVDSNTYDITAWALPYAYGLKTYALTENLHGTQQNSPLKTTINSIEKIPYAWAVNWNSLNSVKFLTALLNNKFKVKFSETPFRAMGKKFNAGTLIISANGNNNIPKLSNVLSELANNADVELTAINSGMVEEGADFGSSNIRFIHQPKVALLAGNEVNSLNFGEVWHFFEQQINYPLSIINTTDLNRVQWKDIDVLIVADGEYDNLDSEAIQNWIKAGGKIIAMGGAVKSYANKKEFSLKAIDAAEDTLKIDKYKNIKPYADRERTALSDNIPGSIYKIDLDNTHPLAFGYPNFYYSLKLDSYIYEYLPNGWNVGTVKKNNYVGGFVGTTIKKKLKDGLLFGVEEYGKGELIYLADDLLFRSFWENGKLMFSNAIFMVGQ